jgi:hypothetical protein
MITMYQIEPNELNQFIAVFRKTFSGKPLKVIVEPMDETDYLLHDNERKERLLTAIDNVRSEKNIVTLNFEDLDEFEKRANL